MRQLDVRRGMTLLLPVEGILAALDHSRVGGTA